MGNCFAYARVSTPRQGEKGVSLPEQKEAIMRYATAHGLEVTRWFEERESASRKGGRAFAEMLRLLRLGRAQGVIIHKIDRSARNLEDWADVARLSDAGVDVHFATENVDLKTVAGRLSADIQAVVAAHYSRNLREEVKKGFYGRLKQGFYPIWAPIGYLDQGSAKVKIPDPIRAPLVREVFSLYNSGEFSLPQLAEEMHRRGLRNRKGGAVSINGLATILRNPFYIGLIRIKKTGQTFNGNHEPLITTDAFETAKAMLDGKRVDRKESNVYTYSRIVRCASCGYSLIAERQKGHIYYRCHNRPFKVPKVCPPTCIREAALDSAMRLALEPVDLSEEELKEAHRILDEQTKEFAATQSVIRESLRLQLDQARTRLARLADLLIDATIDKSMFEEKREALFMEQARIKERLAEVEQNRSYTLESLARTVELAKSPSLLYKNGSQAKKRELLGSLTVEPVRIVGKR